MSEEIPFTTQPVPISPSEWGSYVLRLYIERKPPLLGTVISTKLEEKAKEVLKDREDAFLGTSSLVCWSTLLHVTLRPHSLA
jgi:hypothetical protein